MTCSTIHSNGRSPVHVERGAGTHAPRRRAEPRHGSAARVGPRATRSSGAGRLTAAFDALASLPVHAPTGERLLRSLSGSPGASSERAAIVECDFALALAALRAANAHTSESGRVDGVPAAVELLGDAALRELVERAPKLDFFASSGPFETLVDRFRLHALATRDAADAIAAAIGHRNRDRLAAVSLLHDIGKLALALAYPGYASASRAGAGTPRQRLRAERRELGIEHALLGGVLLRRWRIPSSIAVAVERHHAEELEGEAALVALADMLVHYRSGEPVAPSEMTVCADAVGLERGVLSELAVELPARPRERSVEPCPLTGRELAVLRRLARGGANKQIAQDMSLSVSAVRSHLYNAYRRLGVTDRAQAVLLAGERGWL